MASPRSLPNYLAGPYMERLAQLRKDEARLRAALQDPATLFVPVWRTRSFIARSENTVVAQIVAGLQQFGEVNPSELILLGEFRSRLCFVVEVPSGDAAEPPMSPQISPQLPPDLQQAAEFRDLRTIAGELARDEAGLLAYAYMEIGRASCRERV